MVEIVPIINNRWAQLAQLLLPRRQSSVLVTSRDETLEQREATGLVVGPRTEHRLSFWIFFDVEHSALVEQKPVLHDIVFFFFEGPI